MKNRFENSETFTAYATIDAGMYMLKQLQERAAKPVAPIIQAVDKVCGYDRNRDFCNEAITILNDMIDAAKVINADSSSWIKMRDEINSLLSETNPSFL